MQIHEILEMELKHLNATHQGIKRTTENSCAAKVGHAIDKYNANIDIVNITIDGIEMDKHEIAKIKLEMPTAFKDKKITYTSFASKGKMALEVFE